MKISFIPRKLIKYSLQVNYMYTRLLGRFAPIFYFNCKHEGFSLITHNMRVLLVNKTKTKNFAGFIINFVDFQIFKNRILMEANF